ncbi:hypothetical protein WDZ92_40830 [Nostoc sp. NIES-2111]
MASWLEKRRERRRRRQRMEEVLGWIVVPIIAFGLYWAWLEVHDQIKGTPLMTILQGKSSERPAP